MHRSSQFLLIPLTLGLLMSPFGCAKGGGGGGGTNGGSTGNPSGGSSGNPTGGSIGNPTGGTNRSGGTSGNPTGGTSGNPTGGTSGNPTGGSSGNPTGGTSGNPTGGTSGNPTGGTSGNPTGGTSGNPTGGTSGNPTGGSSGNPSGGTSRSGGIGSSGGTVTTSGGIGTSGGTVTTSGGIGSTGGIGSSGGATGGSNTSACPAGPNVISDFESGKGDMIAQGTPKRSGWWYVYYPGSPNSPVKSGQTQTPAVNTSGPIAVEAAPDASSCNKFALHTKGTGFVGASQDYAGFGAGFLPKDTTGQVFSPYDATAYTGVKFRMKTGSGTAPAVYFEVLTQETVSSAQGGLLGAEGNPSDVPVGLHNNRGRLLNDPWTPGGITSTYQTFSVPFATLVPRWVPAAATCTAAGPKCQAPGFNPAHVLGIQVSMYSGTSPTSSGAGFPTVGTPGTYDLWIDDVEFTTDDSGLQTLPGFPLKSAGKSTMGSCKLPTVLAADGKYLVSAYNQWKANFVKGNKVVRPEASNDTVSEAQAYGMLIAVNMNDKTLFDSLYSGWTASPYTSGSTLMTWCLGSSGGGTGTPCPSGSGGSATDADEDAAFALLQAAKVFGDASYKTKAMAMISEIFSKDIDPTTKLPTGGSNYNKSSGTTNPSYFAPAWYNAFKAAGDTNDWASVNAAVYKAVNASNWTNGLLPAWCSGNTCTAAGSNPGSADPATDGIYQYDAHRIPMRIGLDYCFNGTADAKTYVGKTTTFFATNANAGLNGISRIFDMYQLNGTSAANAANNSASIVGTAAVGAMADGSNQTFINDAYQEVFDLVTRSSMSTIPPAKTAYSYYNATVGMLTLLMMTGNFSH